MLTRCQDNVWRNHGSVAWSTNGGEASLEPISELCQDLTSKPRTP